MSADPWAPARLSQAVGGTRRSLCSKGLWAAAHLPPPAPPYPPPPPSPGCTRLWAQLQGSRRRRLAVCRGGGRDGRSHRAGPRGRWRLPPRGAQGRSRHLHPVEGLCPPRPPEPAGCGVSAPAAGPAVQAGVGAVIPKPGVRAARRPLPGARHSELQRHFALSLGRGAARGGGGAARRGRRRCPTRSSPRSSRCRSAASLPVSC